ncbi:MAG: UDP-N-acetylglucosamine 1-carboxyvinyltransferase [Actinobacteria bacterium]|nr:UDP-N-acetylglucosamine 1-carboxyvinyltransferase [Actinomycetota bacterium]
MSQQFVIQGGHALAGTVTPTGNKNAALPILAATLLTDEEVILENVPDILDVHAMLAILDDIGVSVREEPDGALAFRAHDIRSTDLDPDLCRRIRASVLLAGPLLARTGSLTLPMPGGDFIGRRRIDTHLRGFRALGATVQRADRGYEMRQSGMSGAEIFLDEASVTATENILMAAVLAEGRTTILNAASEPHVQDLAGFLVLLGAKIDGIGTNRLSIDGVERLSGGRFRIGPDYIEIASFIGLAAITGSDLVISEARPADMRMILLGFERLGIRAQWLDDGSLRVPPDQALVVMQDEGGAIPKIDDGPWPAFPADLTSIATAVATQATGEVMIFEKMFENRLFFVDKLVAMGARIILCDPHRAVVSGPAQLYGERVESPDIRAGMAILIAGLAAKGTTTIGNIGQIDRGYERIDERLRALGARIERVDE